MDKTRPRRKAALIIAAASIALIAVGTALIWNARQPAPMTQATIAVTGAITVPGGAAGEDWNIYLPCLGGEHTGDIHTFAPVVITDAAGATLATTEIGYGTLANSTPRDGMTNCRLPFHTQVPSGRGPYGLKIGGQPTLRYSEAELTRGLELILN